MGEPAKRDVLSVELEHERAIRRTANLLQAKRTRIRDDLDCLVTHLTLLIPRSPHAATESESSSELIIEAARRLDDDVFKELLIQVIKAKNI